MQQIPDIDRTMGRPNQIRQTNLALVAYQEEGCGLAGFHTMISAIHVENRSSAPLQMQDST